MNISMEESIVQVEKFFPGKDKTLRQFAPQRVYTGIVS
jgi:hypothetical protein